METPSSAVANSRNKAKSPAVFRQACLPALLQPAALSTSPQITPTPGVALPTSVAAARGDASFSTHVLHIVQASSADGPARKRRRVGRPAQGAPMDADERQRLRKVKNRESAMRSLQKKADYTSKLEEDERTQRAIVSERCDALRALVETVSAERVALARAQVETPEHAILAATVDDCLARCRTLIADCVAGVATQPPNLPAS
jgi:hypothetical protein